jgi:hypothetical protein
MKGSFKEDLKMESEKSYSKMALFIKVDSTLTSLAGKEN